MTPPVQDGRRGSLPRRRWRWVVAGVIAVVACVAVVTVVAARDTERVVVDATTAAAVAIPATPPVLGDKRFELKVSDRSLAQPHVVAAGPGFAVAIDNSLTGYGPDGSQRWHYRTSGATFTEANVYDNGAVIIAALADGTVDTDRPNHDDPPFPQRLVAFDANTGQQLWDSRRDDLRGAFAGYRNPEGGTQTPPQTRFLASSKGTRMVGFDARTGEEAWQESIGCSKTAYTPTQLVCLNVGGADFRAVVVDAATGARTGEWPVSVPEADRPETWMFVSDIAVPSGGQGLAITMWFSTRGTVEQLPSQVVYLDTTTGASVRLGQGNTTTVIGADPRGDLLVTTSSEEYALTIPREYRSATVTLHGPDGAQRCTFAADAAPSGGEHNATAWLTDQLINVVDRGTEANPEQSLTVFDRDCRQLSATPLPAATTITGIVPAPGVTVIARSDDTGTYLDGYAPR
ncbi:PQQ-binding-like beta-propeller repeat protein [Mycolicibacterium wolinskyi]|uniref:outer membrane protein assembly factor BamB family protein n=1 Tax=Mycolicibacterium wolinskyi TaxID=59750 RepID=UPI0009FCA612|nr:PQQ-binding-like beta-propeller repeat protein [Mycolicibacterium wolinskyi]